MPYKINTHLFIAVFLVALVIHSTYFRSLIFIDNIKWTERTANLAQDLLTPPININFYDVNHDFRYGSHPGTSFLLPAAILFKFGLSSQASLTFAITFLTALLTAAIVAICHLLRPKSFWWLAVAFILSIHPLYFYGTPTNILIGPIAALLFLLALVVYEHRRYPLPLSFDLFVSFIFGLGLSTRLHDTVFLGAPLLTFMGAYTKKGRLLFIILSSALFAFLFNPFLWLMPIEYLRIIILRTSSHIIYTGLSGFQLTLAWPLYFSPLSIISFFLAAFFFLLARQQLPLPIPFLLTLFLITVVTCTVFFSSNYQTLRYYYPLIFIWDILLPLFLLRLSSGISFPFLVSARHVAIARQFARLAVVAIVFLSFGFLAAYNLIPPVSQGQI